MSTTRVFLLTLFEGGVFTEASSSELLESSVVLSDICDMLDLDFGFS